MVAIKPPNLPKKPRRRRKPSGVSLPHVKPPAPPKPSGVKLPPAPSKPSEVKLPDVKPAVPNPEATSLGIPSTLPKSPVTSGPSTPLSDGLSTLGESLRERGRELIGELAGPEIEMAWRALEKTLLVADPTVQDAIARAILKFLETGELGYLEPLAVYLAAQIKEARDAHWKDAAALPEEAILQLPEELRAAAGRCRFILASEAHDLSLPAFAIRHLNKADAVVTIDLIFWKKIPGFVDFADLHFWCHELVHVRQYAGLGLEEFARRYVAEEVGDGVNALESEADRVACKYFPIDRPRYIGSCQ